MGVDQMKSQRVKPVARAAARSKIANRDTPADQIAGVRLTHPDRILYPEQGITKRELALYYEAVAAWIMPHLKNRPLTLVRCPQGYKKQCFYQRHTRESIDGTVHSIPIKEGLDTAAYLYVDSVPGLIALVQLG